MGEKYGKEKQASILQMIKEIQVCNKIADLHLLVS